MPLIKTTQRNRLELEGEVDDLLCQKTSRMDMLLTNEQYHTSH